jgi:hypothetical protein
MPLGAGAPSAGRLLPWYVAAFAIVAVLLLLTLVMPFRP